MSFVKWLNSNYEERGPMRWLAFFLELCSAIVLFLLMVLTCVDVVGRYFFSQPLIGATELTEISLSLVIFTAIPVITWRGGHIVVDLIDGIAPPLVLRLLAWFSTCIITLSFYFVALRIYELGARNLKRGITTDFLYLPTGLFIQLIAILSWITAIGLVICTIINTVNNRKAK